MQAIGAFDDFRSSNGQRPDISKKDPAWLLANGLADILERVGQCVAECEREARTGDWQREIDEQARKQAASRVKSRKSDQLTDEQHATITDGCKAIKLAMLYDDAIWMWDVMNEMAAFHNLERPPAWRLNDGNKTDIGTLLDAFRDAQEWARSIPCHRDEWHELQAGIDLDQGRIEWRGRYYPCPQKCLLIIKELCAAIVDGRGRLTEQALQSANDELMGVRVRDAWKNIPPNLEALLNRPDRKVNAGFSLNSPIAILTR